MSNAITKSDNIYFADVALKAGWEKLEPFLKMIGFDERIPFDLRVSKPEIPQQRQLRKHAASRRDRLWAG